MPECHDQPTQIAASQPKSTSLMGLPFPLRWRFLSAPLFLCASVLSLSLLLLSPTTAQTTDLLYTLTLEQKVAQMFMVNVFGETLADIERDFLRDWQPGALVLFNRNTGTPESVTRLTNDIQETVVAAGGLPLLIAVDQEGGIIAHLQDGFTIWPAPMLITATGDPDLAYGVGGAMAQELRAVGVNMNLAPVADLNTNIDNPIIGRRSFGDSPEQVGEIVAAMVRGMQDGGVLATAKHFPGHGDTDSDSHLSLPSLSHSLGRLQSMELPPFEATFAAGVSTVMVAHIYYPALEPEINLPASLSVNVITGLLRDGMDYDGLVMTDALDMDAIDTTYSPASASVRAVRAGVDLIAIGANIGPQAIARAMQAVVDAVRSGEIPEARIDESVRRILDAKARYGILDWQPLDASTASDRIDLGEHALLVDELFRAGVTLVYDHIDTIPLNPDRRITLIYPATRSSIRRACDDYDLSVNWLGVSASPTDIEIDWARSAATMSDVILVFTQNADQNPSQQALVRALPAGKVVVVALQSPYDWWRFPDVAGYLVTFSPIDSAFPAICDILFGTAPARGSLPISFAETVPAGTSAD